MTYPNPVAGRLTYRFLGLTLLLLLSATVRAEKSAPDLDQVRSGTLFLSGVSQLHDAVLLNSKVSMHIAGVVADVQLSQDFENVSGEWVEGIYAFPLPDNAAVRTMTIHVGERKIAGRIRERQEADQQYRLAAAEGKVAGLVRQERDNLFTARIANIAPGEKIRVELDYFQSLEMVGEQISLRLPTTFTPRYFPATLTSPENMAENPARTLLLLDEADEISPDFVTQQGTDNRQMALQVVIDNEFPVVDLHSQSHEVEIGSDDQQWLVSAKDGTVSMDRDFLLNWRLTPSEEPRPALYVQETEQGRFGLLVVQPPAINETIATGGTAGRDIVFVLDTSGSMAGNSMRAAKSALTQALNGLRPQDRYNIIHFNNSARRLFDRPQAATAALIANGKRYIQTLDADGGTEMLSAVELALEDSDSSLERLTQVVFITDGSVGNEQEVFRKIQRDLGDRRLFTVGIGSAPNDFFMRQAAGFGRGSFRYIANVDDVEQEISALLEQLSSPVLTSLQIFDDQGREPEFYPDPVPDLYSGQPLILSLKLADDTTQLVLQGEIAGETWQKELNINMVRNDASGIASVWARQKINQLMNRQWLQADDELHKAEIIELSKNFGVMSRWTSFLAEEETPVRITNKPLRQQRLSNLLPVGLPQGATGLYAWFAAAIMLLLIGVAINADRLQPEKTE